MSKETAEKGAGAKERVELKADPKLAKFLRVASALEGRSIVEIVEQAVREHYAESPLTAGINALVAAAS